MKQLISDRLKKHRGMGGFDQAIPSIVSVNELPVKKLIKKETSTQKITITEASPGKNGRKRILITDATPNRKTKPTEETEDDYYEGKEMATQITE